MWIPDHIGFRDASPSPTSGLNTNRFASRRVDDSPATPLLYPLSSDDFGGIATSFRFLASEASGVDSPLQSMGSASSRRIVMPLHRIAVSPFISFNQMSRTPSNVPTQLDINPQVSRPLVSMVSIDDAASVQSISPHMIMEIAEAFGDDDSGCRTGRSYAVFTAHRGGVPRVHPSDTSSRSTANPQQWTSGFRAPAQERDFSATTRFYELPSFTDEAPVQNASVDEQRKQKIATGPHRDCYVGSSKKQIYESGGYISPKYYKKSFATVATQTEEPDDSDSAPSGCISQPYVPYNPYRLRGIIQRLLEFTELPFLILWVYFVYFVVIVALTASSARQLVWVSAAVAGLLVGVGLNANAYRAVMYKGSPDYGMIVRFFLIPFGVSALSGLTNSMRNQFMLVFPKDPIELCIAVFTPSLVVVCLLVSRLFLLWRCKVPVNMRNFALNGKICQ